MTYIITIDTVLTNNVLFLGMKCVKTIKTYTLKKKY